MQQAEGAGLPGGGVPVCAAFLLAFAVAIDQVFLPTRLRIVDLKQKSGVFDQKRAKTAQKRAKNRPVCLLVSQQIKFVRCSFLATYVNFRAGITPKKGRGGGGRGQIPGWKP